MHITVKALSLAACLSFSGVTLAQAPQTTRVPGEVTAVTAKTITVKHTSGETVVVDADDKVPVVAMKKLTRADIKSGTFVGVGAKVGADGKQTAVQIVIFPEASRGTGEGHRGWNMGPDSTMTNANVDAVVEGAGGNDLKLSYKGGTQTIAVPADVKVLGYVPATRADVKVGKKVVINAVMKDSRPTATRVLVEKDGVVPPM